MRKVQSEASNNEVEVITLTVMLQLGIQDDKDAEYIVLLELSPE